MRVFRNHDGATTSLTRGVLMQLSPLGLDLRGHLQADLQRCRLQCAQHLLCHKFIEHAPSQ